LRPGQSPLQEPGQPTLSLSLSLSLAPRAAQLALSRELFLSRTTLALSILILALLAQLLFQHHELKDQSAEIQELKVQASLSSAFSRPPHLESHDLHPGSVAASSCPAPSTKTVYHTDLICPNPQKIRSPGTFFASVERSMSLADSARKVAAEFEYSAEDVNKGVKQFLKQMGMFLLCVVYVFRN